MVFVDLGKMRVLRKAQYDFEDTAIRTLISALASPGMRNKPFAPLAAELAQ
jgi:hypothetical protein